MNTSPLIKHDSPGSLIQFFLLTYAVMWAAFGTVALARIPTSTPAGVILIHIGAYSPSFVALWITARREGRAGIRALVEGVFKWQVRARWYLFAVGFIPAIKVTVAVIHRLTRGEWPRFGDEPMYLIPLAIAFSTPFQAGEEIGWRGFALPRLNARLGLVRASLLLGLIWALWHIPQFFIPEADTYGQSFFVYVLQVIAISVAMAWLYMQTNGSLLLVMLLHAAVNNAKGIAPSATPGAANTFTFTASLVGWLTVTLLWICAAYFLWQMWRWDARVATPSYSA